jgi:hypothetical protein
MTRSLSEGWLRRFAIALLTLFESVLVVMLSAQVVGATVSVRVVDPSGAMTPGSSVSIENVATGAIANGVTNAVGFYSIRLGDAIRNSLVGPRLVDLEFLLFKNVPVKRISDNFGTQFRMEFFNVLNHPNFASPNANRTILNRD